MFWQNVVDHWSDHRSDLFWLSPTNQFLWHIHRFSSILFCLLVLLNLLSGADQHKQNEPRKNSTVNVIAPTDEDELAREIMALFDYEERWMSDGNGTNLLNNLNFNGTQSENGTFLNSTDQKMDLLMFNTDTDPNADFVAQNLTGNLSTKEKMPKFEKKSKETKHSQEGKTFLENINNEHAPIPIPMPISSTTTVSPNMITVPLNKSLNSAIVATKFEKDTKKTENGTKNANGNEPKMEIGKESVKNANKSEKVGQSLPEVNTTSVNTTAPSVQQFGPTVINSYSTYELVTSTLPFYNASTVSRQSENNFTNGLENTTLTTKLAKTISTISESPTVQSITVSADLITVSAESITVSTVPVTMSSIIGVNETNVTSGNVVKKNHQNMTTAREQQLNDQQIDSISTDKKSAEIGGELVIMANDTKAGMGEEMAGEEEEEVKEVLEELKKRVERRLNIGDAEFVELSEYRQHLRQILNNVESALTKWSNLTSLKYSDFPKSRRLIAISSSLPNRNSNVFIARKNAILSSISSNLDDIRKSPPNLGKAKSSEQSTQSTTTTLTTPPTPTTASIAKQTGKSTSSEDSDETANNPRKTGFFRAEYFSSKYFPFNTLRNLTAEQCKHLSQEDLVLELKQKGTYNPELMAWDVSGVFRFLDKTITDQYERQSKPPKSSDQAVKRNVEALERLLAELNLRCDVRSPEVLSRLGNLTIAESKRSIISPSLRHRDQLMRHKRNAVLAEQLFHQSPSPSANVPTHNQQNITPKNKKQKIIGDVHVVPFGCDKRGGSEDGYLRLCGACQAIRKLPDEFFPPFINEVMCDEDKACLYFYDYPHGKCKQKHMNFVVLRNVGTKLCQIWEKYNMNVRVSCECFVDEMSFFSKYV